MTSFPQPMRMEMAKLRTKQHLRRTITHNRRNVDGDTRCKPPCLVHYNTPSRRTAVVHRHTLTLSRRYTWKFHLCTPIEYITWKSVERGFDCCLLTHHCDAWVVSSSSVFWVNATKMCGWERQKRKEHHSVFKYWDCHQPQALQSKTGVWYICLKCWRDILDF